MRLNLSDCRPGRPELCAGVSELCCLQQLWGGSHHSASGMLSRAKLMRAFFALRRNHTCKLLRQRAPGIFLPLLLQLWDSKCVPSFYIGAGMDFRSPHFHSEHFTHWAIPQALLVLLCDVRPFGRCVVSATTFPVHCPAAG